MIVVFPAGAFSTFPLMVCLSSTPCRQLNALRDDHSAISAMNEEMYVIGSSHAIQDDHPLPLLGLEEPVDPGLAILGKLQQECLLVATMCDVPRVTGYGMPVRSWHALWISCLNKPIPMAKWAR
jgi:hypothetical protein